jgi:hypothetical protein
VNVLIDIDLSPIWDSLTSWIPPQLLVPEFIAAFWIVVAIVLGGAAIAYFIPMLRSLFGAVGMAAIAFVVGIWKGIGYQAAKQQEKERREIERQQKEQRRPPIKFPWPF